MTLYVKIKEGKHAGKTLYASMKFPDESILVRIEGLDWYYKEGEWEEVFMYGRKAQ